VRRIWLFIRRVGLEIYCFVTTPLVAKNCLGMLTFITAFFMLTFWWLQCYTNHGVSIEVPNYEGLNFRDAARKAKSSGFDVAVADSIYMEGKAPGEVIGQNPKAASKVKEGRTLYFTVAKGNPDLVVLPALVGSDDYDLYSRKCSRLGIKTRIAGRVQDASEPNTILAVLHRRDTITNLITRGYKVEMGATLDFIVSDAQTNTIAIPECVCQTFDAAKFLIKSSGLQVGAVIKNATVTDPETAYIWRQSPTYTADGTVTIGTAIDLYLTQEAPAGCR
jgi:beta-lactam-binding protein with PASTA domain